MGPTQYSGKTDQTTALVNILDSNSQSPSPNYLLKHSKDIDYADEDSKLEASNDKQKSYELPTKRNTTSEFDNKRSFQLKDRINKPLLDSKQTKAESLGAQGIIIEGKSPTA